MNPRLASGVGFLAKGRRREGVTRAYEGGILSEVVSEDVGLMTWMF